MDILLVDDSAVMRSIIARTLKIAGLPIGKLYQAGNGQEGLDVLEAHKVDVVLTDINMPEMNGMEMLDNMRAKPEMKDVPVLMISTEGSQTRISEISGKGARFLQKPFTPESLKEAVEGALGGE